MLAKEIHSFAQLIKKYINLVINELLQPRTFLDVTGCRRTGILAGARIYKEFIREIYRFIYDRYFLTFGMLLIILNIYFKKINGSSPALYRKSFQRNSKTIID